MPNKAVISTEGAPAAIGTYSQAIKVNNTVYLSGQIPLVPQTMKMVEGDFAAQAEQVFLNLQAVCQAANGDLQDIVKLNIYLQAVCQAANGDLQDIVKLNIYLTDLTHFPMVNEIMGRFIKEPYPARAAIGVKELPRGALIEADGIMVV